jgi:hypothetical protein
VLCLFLSIEAIIEDHAALLWDLLLMFTAFLAQVNPRQREQSRRIC